MPVSKKRKKDGKPVHRSQPPPAPGGEHVPAPEVKQTPLQQRAGRPTNPFVAQQTKRASQRGR
jgi:hypothetical protein